MRRPEVNLARATDGTYLAYQCLGSGPIDIFWQSDTFAMVDLVWDSPPERALLDGLAEFARVIIHDKRGTGLSSRNTPPGDLETQVADVLTVLDAVGVEKVVLGGVLEGGASNVLLAATHPARVESLVWLFPTPRTTATGDYPWGVSAEWVERELAMVEWWGSPRWLDEFFAMNDNVLFGVWATEEYRRFILRASLRTCSPDVQAELCRIWYDTDVRGALSSVQVPTLLMTDTTGDELAKARSVAEKIPRAEIFAMEDLLSDFHTFPALHAAIRQFVGAERPVVGMDSVLATVLFTDIVNSTETQASLHDHRWKELIEAHHAIVRSALDRWRGVENDTAGDGFFATFDGPARAIRCALEIIAAVGEPRDRGSGRRAHRRVRADRRQDRGDRRDDRRADLVPGRPLTGTRLPDGAGPRGGLRPDLPGQRSAHAQRGARRLAPLRGDRLTPPHPGAIPRG